MHSFPTLAPHPLTGILALILIGSSPASEVPRPHPTTPDLPPASPSAPVSQADTVEVYQSPDGQLLEIADVELASQNGNLHHLTVTITASEPFLIENSKVDLQIYLLVEVNGELQLLERETENRWLTVPIDWKKPEKFQTAFDLDSTPEADAQQPRTFAGCVIAIYHHDRLVAGVRQTPGIPPDHPLLADWDNLKYRHGSDQPH